MSEVVVAPKATGDTTLGWPGLPADLFEPAKRDSAAPKTLLDIVRAKQGIAPYGKPEAKDTINKYETAKQLNYNVEYAIDQMVTQIDFTYLNFAYQPFTGSSVPDFVNPGLNALLMVGITDLMEDYRISGGVRLNINLINNEYLFSYSNNRRRLDHQIVFHRKAVEEYTYYSIIRHKIHELYYVATYPFTPVLNIRGTASVRYDKAVYLSTDQYNLKEPDLDKIWGSLKGELTYDNTRSLGLNLYQGTRYKFWGVLSVAERKREQHGGGGGRHQKLSTRAPHPHLGQPVCHQHLLWEQQAALLHGGCRQLALPQFRPREFHRLRSELCFSNHCHQHARVPAEHPQRKQLLRLQYRAEMAGVPLFLQPADPLRFYQQFSDCPVW